MWKSVGRGEEISVQIAASADIQAERQAVAVGQLQQSAVLHLPPGTGHVPRNGFFAPGRGNLAQDEKIAVQQIELHPLFPAVGVLPARVQAGRLQRDMGGKGGDGGL